MVASGPVVARSLVRVNVRRDGPRRHLLGVSATYLSGSSPGGPRVPPLAIGTASSSVRETLGSRASQLAICAVIFHARPERIERLRLPQY